MTRSVAVVTLLVCVACGADEPTAPGPEAVTAAPTPSADSTFVAALRAKLTTDTETGLFSGAMLVTRNGRTLAVEPTVALRTE